MMRLVAAFGLLIVAVRSALAAGSAEAAPGVHRPDWVIWAALGAFLLVLFVILLATQGGWRGKRGRKIEPPYF